MDSKFALTQDAGYFTTQERDPTKWRSLPNLTIQQYSIWASEADGSTEAHFILEASPTDKLTRFMYLSKEVAEVICAKVAGVFVSRKAFLKLRDDLDIAQRELAALRGSEVSAIRMARRAALALKERYGDSLVSVTLKDGEVCATLSKDPPLDADIEQTADVIDRLYANGHRITLKNRDNPIR